MNPRSGCKHKAWGEAKRNPRIVREKETERAKRAIVKCFRIAAVERLPPTSWALYFCAGVILGFRFRSTPGFMLSPRFAGSVLEQ
jgi:hypothetical protein